MTNLLEVRGLTKSYGAFTLRGVDLDVPSGAITGGSGATARRPGPKPSATMSPTTWSAIAIAAVRPVDRIPPTQT